LDTPTRIYFFILFIICTIFKSTVRLFESRLFYKQLKPIPMKLTCKVSLSFKQLKVAKKPAFGTNAILCLTALAALPGNLFPDLPITLKVLQADNDSLAAAIANALSGSRAAIAAVKAAAIIWDADMKSTALYISACAPGNEEAILTTGFFPTKSESTPKPLPAAIGDFKATPTNQKGTVTAASKSGLRGILAYITAALPVGATLDFNGSTMIITIGTQSIYINADTRRSTKVNSMPTAVPYNITMFGVNAAGIGPAATTQQVVSQ
jgi:hypothetical protein